MAGGGDSPERGVVDSRATIYTQQQPGPPEVTPPTICGGEDAENTGIHGAGTTRDTTQCVPRVRGGGSA